MSRMLDALRTLESRKTREHEPSKQSPLELDNEPAASPLDLLQALEDAVQSYDEEPLRAAAPQPSAPFETCLLPTVPQPAACYQQMAGRIREQLSVNYSNVLLLAFADAELEPAFSMTELAQAFALQSAGDVLLVDGDLRSGRLSQQVARRGPGMVEAMLGKTPWPDLIHPTNLPRVDFVARGNALVPTVERSEFNWAALRPMYRWVLIGPANVSEPETLWLASRCDAVYYVLSRPHTRRSAASAALGSLRSGGANVAGCIVVGD